MANITATSKSGIKISIEYCKPKTEFSFCKKEVFARINGKQFKTEMSISPSKGELFLTAEMLKEMNAPKSVIDALKKQNIVVSVDSTYEQCKLAYQEAVVAHYQEKLKLGSYNGMPNGIWAIPKDEKDRMGFLHIPADLAIELSKLEISKDTFADALYKAARKGLLPDDFSVKGGTYIWEGYEMTSVESVIFSPAAAMEILPILFPKRYKALENEKLAFEEAKRKGKRVLISNHVGESKDYSNHDESTTCDVYIWALPNGETQTTVSHHY